MSRPPKTDEELRQLGIDFYKGAVFTSMNISPEHMQEMFTSVFMAICFLDQESKKELLDQNPYVFYEYMSKAGPSSINGYPCFLTFQWVTREEWVKALQTYQKLVDAVAPP
jgi:hypothetical protein